MIIPKSKVIEAVARCLAMNDDLDAAIESVAQALHLTPEGNALMEQAEATAYDLEQEATSRMTATQRATMIRLLKMVYLAEPKTETPASSNTPVKRARRSPRST